MDKESIFNSPRILFFARCSFFNVSKISNEQSSSSSSSNDSLFFTFAVQMAAQKSAKETHWLVTTPGIDKSAYDLQNSAFQGKTTWAMISVWWSGDSRSNTRQCIITHNALRLPPSPANNFWLLYGLIVSHAGVFRGARISSLPTTRDEIRLTTAING